MDITVINIKSQDISRILSRILSCRVRSDFSRLKLETQWKAQAIGIKGNKRFQPIRKHPFYYSWFLINWNLLFPVPIACAFYCVSSFKHNRHRQQEITSYPIRALGYNIELALQSSDWTARYSLLSVPIVFKFSLSKEIH